MLREKTLKTLQSSNTTYHYASLPELEKVSGINISKLPYSIRIVLESVLRNCDGKKVTEKDIKTLAQWNAKKPLEEEIPFTVARIVLQDFTGVPLLVDLAAMRTAVAGLKKDPKAIEPLVPVDLVIDHSVQVDVSASPEALQKNMDLEFSRNKERYEFLKWGQQAFKTFRVVPPGIGIVHQVNLEYLAKGVFVSKDAKGNAVAMPDTLVGTDSHTTMINGVGVVAWGVGGIEAEAGMLGQPLYFLTPEVVGVYLKGQLKEGVTATDLTLTVTEMLRKAKVVGKFVEFYGPGATTLSAADRATIANMAPEYGATMGFFGVDDETVNYFRGTGRSEAQCQLIKDYYTAQGLFGIPKTKDELNFSVSLELDLASIEPSVAGPKRPQDRIALSKLKSKFTEIFTKPTPDGFGKNADGLAAGRDLTKPNHGSVLIAAITSCTNTSNPSVMIAAGLLAKKAVEKGLKVNTQIVKTSLAPGSRVVTEYLGQTGLQTYLDKLGFNLVGYGCTTCIGNSGPLKPEIEAAITEKDLVAASVLSGNRNFEARVHPAIKANFLMSPPLVVAFAIAGRADIDLSSESLGKGSDGKDVFLKDVWPSMSEVQSTLKAALRPEIFQKMYKDFAELNPAWNKIPSVAGELYQWKNESTYIQQPPFFQNFSLQPGTIGEIKGARALAIFGDSVTTDHISPAGSFKKETPAGQYLSSKGVQPVDFNSYGSRRGNDKIMTRGTFANVRIKNLMLPGVEGGFTKDLTSSGKEKIAIFDAAEKYKSKNTPLIVMGGKEYGTGSSRDWAAKGTQLLGVKVVIAESFERIHRSNLVGMGVLPCCFEEGTNAQSLGLTGDEEFSILGLSPQLKPRQKLTLEIKGPSGTKNVSIICRIDTPIEVDYYQHGGILPYVLREIIQTKA